MTIYVVAISRKEAQELARDLPELRHTSRADAEEHLADVKAPPTDSYYAAQYKVWPVSVEG